MFVNIIVLNYLAMQCLSIPEPVPLPGAAIFDGKFDLIIIAINTDGCLGNLL